MSAIKSRNADNSIKGNSYSSMKSVPAILCRKRKADAMIDLEYDEIDLSCKEENLNSSSFVTQSNRMPLSTLQNSNVISSNRQNEDKPANNPMPKFNLYSDNSPINPPSAKKMKMRKSWAEFREYTQSCMLSSSRSKTPFPSLKWTDCQEMWDLICKKEKGMYAKKTQHEILNQHPSLQPRMRTILLDWLAEVCEVYKQHRETFYLAVDFLDRYLSKTTDMPKNRLQLIGITCLFISSKIEEIYPPKLHDFAYITDGSCTEEEILNMELVILKELNWGLSPMTPNSWVKMFMQVSNCDHRPDSTNSFVIPQYSGLPFSRVMQLLDLVTLDMGSLSFTNSVLATAALCHMQNREVALAISGYSWPEVSKCVHWLAPFVQALREDSTHMQIKTFHSVPIDDQHNIQCHSVEISILDRVHEIMASRNVASPRNSSLLGSNYSVDMTPPNMSTDVRFRPSRSITENSANSVLVSQRQNQPNSIFLSPESPAPGKIVGITQGTTILLN